jgi:hypothetical protein
LSSGVSVDACLSGSSAGWVEKIDAVLLERLKESFIYFL